MMKASIIKKMMTGALAVSLVMAPVMSVGATTVTPDTPSAVEEAVESSTSSASGESSTVADGSRSISCNQCERDGHYDRP